MTFWQKQGDPVGCMKEEMIRSAHRPDRNDLKIVPKRRIYSYYSQPNRAFDEIIRSEKQTGSERSGDRSDSHNSHSKLARAARLRATTYGLRWVLPIAEGDF